MDALFAFSKILSVAMIAIVFLPGTLDVILRIWSYTIQMSPPPRDGLSVVLYFNVASWSRPIRSIASAIGMPLLFRMMLLMMAWPWLTVLTLLIFQQSLRRAKIKPGHVARAAVYTGSVGIVLLCPLAWWINTIATTRSRSLVSPLTEPQMIGPVTFLLAVMTYRLWIAYRSYMGFPHAFATALGSQLIVMLTVYTVLVLTLL
jgi:hypothetical protein